jgi:hypothetical protein
LLFWKVSRFRSFSLCDSVVYMKASTWRWWNDINRGEPSALRKTYCSPTLTATDLTPTDMGPNGGLHGERGPLPALTWIRFKHLFVPRSKHTPSRLQKRIG